MMGSVENFMSVARMAAAWLIGLGPVGWIILGVTGIIAWAIAPWKANFLGVRDWLTRVWQTIRESAKKHGIVCFNPQRAGYKHVESPQSLARNKWLSFQAAVGCFY